MIGSIRSGTKQEVRFFLSLQITATLLSLDSKSTGKSLSFGTIALFCLNLPLSLRLKSENIFLYTVTPGPHEPSTTQLNHLLRSLVDDLLRFWSPGLKIPTASSPKGKLYRAALVTLVADLPAARKTAGFASHAANLFCSWCFLSKADIGNLDSLSWERRNRQAHLEAERIWLDAQTQTARGRCLTATGVRWSILNELPYWDATRMVILDIMHNLSGVMQCHAMELFGFGGDMKRFEKKKAERAADDESDASEGESVEEQTEAEEAESEDWDRERKGLAEESGTVNRQGISLKLGRSNIESTLSPNPSFTNTTLPLDDESEDETFAAPRHLLSKFSLATLRSTISSTSIPSWIDRPPTNLGEPSHGKTKSDTWFKLYQIFIPLAACQVWQPKSDGQLENLFTLICAINLTSSHTVTTSLPSTLARYLRSYLNSLRELHPQIRLRPNHHYMLHIPGMIERVGSLAPLAAWAGERLNRELGGASNNGKTRMFLASSSRS